MNPYLHNERRSEVMTNSNYEADEKTSLSLDQFSSDLKINFLNEIRFHKHYCKGDEHCKVLVSLLYELAERAGIKLTKDEKIL